MIGGERGHNGPRPESVYGYIVPRLTSTLCGGEGGGDGGPLVYIHPGGLVPFLVARCRVDSGSPSLCFTALP